MGGFLDELVLLEMRRLDGWVPEGVVDLIYMWNLRDFVEFAGRGCSGADYCVGVSELVYCSRRALLRKRYPEPVVAGNLYAAWAVYGRLVHRGLQDLLREHGFEVEKGVEKLVRFDDMVVRVTGRLDAFGVWRGKATVVEIKSSRSDVDLPKQPHVLQLRIYMNLAGAGQGILVYVTPDRVTEYVYGEPIGDAELKQLVMETVLDKKHPRWDWECSYCPYNSMCPFKKTNNRFYKR